MVAAGPRGRESFAREEREVLCFQWKEGLMIERGARRGK
jgi:hypothetical protein